MNHMCGDSRTNFSSRVWNLNATISNALVAIIYTEITIISQATCERNQSYRMKRRSNTLRARPTSLYVTNDMGALVEKPDESLEEDLRRQIMDLDIENEKVIYNTFRLRRYFTLFTS